MKIRPALISVALMFASCSAHLQPKEDHYPANWRPLVKSGGECELLAGVYEAKGEHTSSGAQRKDLWCTEELLKLLFGSLPVEPSHVDSIIIEQSSCDDIAAAAWSKDSREVARRMVGPDADRGEWRDGFALDFAEKEESVKAAGLKQQVKKTDSLFIREDRALIGGFRREVIGTAIHNANWCSFRRRGSL